MSLWQNLENMKSSNEVDGRLRTLESLRCNYGVDKFTG
jgi:hypothetical protein